MRVKEFLRVHRTTFVMNLTHAPIQTRTYIRSTDLNKQGMNHNNPKAPNNLCRMAALVWMVSRCYMVDILNCMPTLIILYSVSLGLGVRFVKWLIFLPFTSFYVPLYSMIIA
ncbi:hypothetical protein F4677DRAFT_371052 [Hypoxylon crocopeplum]|nr:hypothetical protein F4677DRAFT_371052 [Hypoxylon crocopeplum]